MRLTRNIMTGVAALVVAVLSACAGPDTTTTAASRRADTNDAVAVTDLQGKHVRPFSSINPGTALAAVFIFITTDCPICNASAPEIQRIAADYSGRGVAFYIVHTDPDVTRDAAVAHAREYGYDHAAGARVLLDPEHKLVAKLGAKVTPEAFVITSRETVYRGRIDDLFPERGKKRDAPTTHELRDAIEDVLARRPVRIAETKALGCYISPAPSGG